MLRYKTAGLELRSTLALPSLAPISADQAPPPDLDIALGDGPRPPRTQDGTAMGPNWARSDGFFDLHAPGVALFRIHDEGNIAVWPETDDPDDLGAFLTGSVLGIAAHLRGIIVLHASAVAPAGLGGGAVAFCGVSGAGKSTLAAALRQRGHRVICDDVLALHMDGAHIKLHSDGRKLKLWDKAIEKLGLGDARGAAVRSGFEKYHIDPPNEDTDQGTSDTHRLRALYILREDRTRSESCVEQLDLASSASAIRRNAYRPFLVRRLNDERLYFTAAAKILRQASVYSFTRPMRFEALDNGLEALEAHWAEMVQADASGNS